ncbi:MAG: hypothetical protein NTV63_05370, partial [Candidatus Woesearchaeota archaeon]|nr:hypothetical protein [Candidatus Woesearchaeota archaeon]
NSISKFAVRISNDYLQSVSGEDFGKVVYTETGTIDTVEVLVSEFELQEDSATGYSKADDSFEITGRGNNKSLISSAIEDENRESFNRYTAAIYPLRFWYLYRKIRIWAEQRTIGSSACAQMPLISGTGSGQCPTIKISDASADLAVKEAVDILKKSFDDNVTCSSEMLCRYAQTDEICSPGCSDPCTCASTSCSYKKQCDKEPQCTIGTDSSSPTCENPSDIPNPPNANGAPFDNVCKEPNAETQCPGDCFGYGEEHTLKFIANITCIDKKYQNPVSTEGFKNLKFSFLVHVYLKHRIEAPSTECECPPVIVNPSPGPGPTATPTPGTPTTVTPTSVTPTSVTPTSVTPTTVSPQTSVHTTSERPTTVIPPPPKPPVNP